MLSVSTSNALYPKGLNLDEFNHFIYILTNIFESVPPTTDKILDAAEVAEKQALSATSSATTRMVSNRY
jgi:hypothetical protein